MSWLRKDANRMLAARILEARMYLIITAVIPEINKMIYAIEGILAIIMSDLCQIFLCGHRRQRDEVG